MKKLTAALLALLLVMTACAAFAETVTIDVNNERGITPNGRLADGSFANNPRIEGESMTTGLPWSGVYIPMLVNIDNDPSARLQWGVAQADIIYEVPIQNGGYTRTLYLFADQLPEQAGPIRSTRIMQAEIREEWDGVLVNYGAQTNEGTSANSYLNKQGVYKKGLSIDGIRGGKTWTNMFKRVKIHGAPHNVTVYLQQVATLVSDYPFPERPFLFTDEQPTLGDTATTIDIIQANNHNYCTHYEYNAETNAYLRWIAEQPFTDYNDPDTQLSYQNIIVQNCEVVHYQGYSTRPLVTEVGEGNCEIFTGGKYIAGYWVRPTVESRTVYFDSEGNEIKLQRGKTVIVVANRDRVQVTYEK